MSLEIIIPTQPTRFSDGSEKAKNALAELGLKATAVEKGMKTDAVATIVDLFGRLSRHGDQAKVAMQLFGKEWWDDVLRARKVMPEFLRLLERTRDPKLFSGSLDKAMNVELSTTDRHLKSIREAAGEIGNRLGKWALPPINEAIDRLLAGLDEIDRRAVESRKAKEAVASEDATAGKVASGKPLTREERERMATDQPYRQRVESKADDKRTDILNVSIADRLRLGELESERDRLSQSIETRRQSGAGEEQLAFSIRRLAEIVASIRQIDPQRAPPEPTADPRKPADQEDRREQRPGMPDRAQVLALRERVNQLERRAAAFDSLANTMRLPADRQGFRDDAQAVRRREAEARAKLMVTVAPQLMASTRFQRAQTEPAPPVASGRDVFTLAGPSFEKARQGVADWARRTRDNFEIDLGPAGMTIMERLAAGIQSGGQRPESAAHGVRNGITGTFDGADLSGAGTAMMDGLATGIRAGGARAIAEAQRVVQQIEATAASASKGFSPSPARSRALSGALHDGVD